MAVRDANVRSVVLLLAFALLTSQRLDAGTIEGRVLRASPDAMAGFVVFVDDIRGGFPARKDIAVVDQKQLRFSPHVLVVPMGTTVEFPNSDPVSHNVFSISPAKRFNLGLYVPGAIRRITFDQPGVVELLCNVHLEMSGYVVVVPNPYFARVEADGTFRIPDVPPGRRRIRCWSKSTGLQEIEVDVPASGRVAVDFSARQ